ncbi:MAG: hypothetical protein ACREI2_11585 [Nitrospiraceae bacterium]
MAALTIQEIVVGGAVPTYAAAAAGGDTFAPTAQQPHVLHVKNGGAGSINVVVDDPNSVNPGSATAFDPDVTVAVAAGAEKMIRLGYTRFRNTGTGAVSITYSGVTTVTVAVFVMP